jgi:outer membrane protein assembly factor BamB
LKKNISEIQNDPALKIYGVFLFLAHFLTIFFWRTSLRSNLLNPICWPFFESCEPAAKFLGNFTTPLLTLYFIATGVGLVSYLLRRWQLGYYSLLIVSLFKFGILCLSYRFMGNYHYMMLIVCGTYLLLPAKRLLIPLLIVAFYVSAGSLKFNDEWLSGSALLRPLPFGDPFKTWALWFVLPLELFISYLLLVRNRYIFGLAAISFIAFHLLSWPVVGYFYPLTMFCLLSIFILVRIYGEPANWRDITLHPNRKVVFFTIAIFAAAQLVPYLKTGDSSLTGEGRIMSLNMLDSFSECQIFSFAKFENRVEEISQKRLDLGVRIHCDPIVLSQEIRGACLEAKTNSDFLDIDFAVLSRRRTDRFWTTIIDEKNFCSGNHSLSMWPINHWIKSERNQTRISEQAAWPISIKYAKNNDIDIVKTDSFSKNQSSGHFLGHVSGNLKSGSNDETKYPAVSSLFRGDVAHTGRSNQPSPKWSALKEKFRVANGNVGIHGAAKSSPAVDESGIYIGGDSGWLFAYDWNGAVRWKFFMGQADRGIHGTAALDANSVYLGSYSGRFYKIDKQSGRLVWSIHLGNAFGASPNIWGDSVFVAVETNHPNGFLVRLDRETGDVKWISTWLGQQTHSTPTISEKLGLVNVGGDVKSTLPIDGDTLYVTGWNKKLMALDATSGKTRWNLDMNSKTRSSPSIWREAKAIVSTDEAGGIFLADQATGNLRWQKQFDKKLSSPSSPVISEGKYLVITCRKNTICVFDTKGRELAQIQTRARVSSTPVIFDRKLIVSEDVPGDLVVYEERAKIP